MNVNMVKNYDKIQNGCAYLFLQFVLTSLTNVVTVDTTKNLGVWSVGFTANLESPKLTLER